MPSPNSASKTHILIVDDQKLHALYLQKVLQQEGYEQVRCEFDSRRVFPAVQEAHPDLIILDLFMPHLDGFQVLGQLQEIRKKEYLPVLVLSSDSSSTTHMKALESGATDFLIQPYETIEIVFRIRNMLEMRSLQQQVQDQNRILEAKVQERTQELRSTQLDIIRRLAQAAEFRDNDTGTHIIRMSQYCAKLAEALGLSDAQCELILNASPLHDIGKIGIPDRILLKPAALTPEEYDVMKTHTIIGGKLLAGSTSAVMKMAQQIALTHHEKWDGTGYPNKLKGDDIPFVGQLCSVCDVFDALTANRPYKKAWSTEEAIQELVKQKDKHFNAALVDQFVQILPEIEAIKRKYPE